MSTREKAASVVMGHIPTTDAGALASYMAGTGIGGFILMGANIPPTEGELRAVTAALTIDAALPPLIAIDQEGGDVSRLPWDGFPSALTLKDRPPDASAGRLRRRAARSSAGGDRRQLRHRRRRDRRPVDASSTDARSGRRRDAGAERVAAAVDGERRRAVDAQALPGSRRRAGRLACRHPVDGHAEGRVGSRRTPCRSRPGSTPARRC